MQHVPVTTIAKLLNLTETRIQQLAKIGVIPKEERGQYNLVGCVQGYVRYLKEEARQGKNDDEMYHHKTRMVQAKANIAELQARQMGGELLPADDVAREWAEMVTNMRARLLGLPTKLASQISGLTDRHEIQKLLRTQIYETLRELGDSEGSQD
jgi:phage terminase Nu1 subunit (DNA packaging protein)